MSTTEKSNGTLKKKSWNSWYVDGNLFVVAAAAAGSSSCRTRFNGHATLPGFHTGAAFRFLWRDTISYVT